MESPGRPIDRAHRRLTGLSDRVRHTLWSWRVLRSTGWRRELSGDGRSVYGLAESMHFVMLPGLYHAK